MSAASIPVSKVNEWVSELRETADDMVRSLIPPAPAVAKITVNSVNQNSSPIVGYFVSFTDGNGATVHGFTPIGFDTQTGKACKVSISDYGEAKFSRWSDGGTSRERTITPTGNRTITAVFQVGGTTPAPAPSPPSGSAKAGTVVPLYTYPGHASWNVLIAAKQANPSVPIIAIVNPSSGVGRTGVKSGGLFFSMVERQMTKRRRTISLLTRAEALEKARAMVEPPRTRAIDSNYSTGIKRLSDAGIIVLGYVSTAYGNRSASSIRAEIDTWYSWYPGIKGIFFDEQPNWGGWETHYKNLTSHVKSKQAAAVTIGNPGADSIPSYLSTVDIVIVYESPGLPSLSSYQTKWSSYDNWKIGMIPFGVASLPTDWVRQCAGFCGWIYVQSDVLSNPWDSVPAYFGSLVNLLGSL